MPVTIRDIYLILLSMALLFATIGLAPNGPHENKKVHPQSQHSHSPEELISRSNFQQFNSKDQI